MSSATRHQTRSLSTPHFHRFVLSTIFVENTRVGQDTDFDRLIFEVTTDGRITPVEAINFAAQITIKNFEVFGQVNAHQLTFDEGLGKGIQTKTK